MKRILITLTLFFSVIAASFAQAPQKFSYQAVVRNESNTLVRGTVGVRVSILQGSVNGTVVYQESHITTTNANGLMTLEIGGSSLLSGDFATIDWANGPYFLKTETDPYGGTNYTIEGTQQLLSVPYALYAGSAANSFSGSYNDLTDLPEMPDIPTNVSAFNNDAGYITMDSVPEIPTNVSAFVNDAGYVTESTLTTENYITQNDLVTNNYVTSADIPTNVSAFNNDAGYITANDVPAYQVLSISNDTIFLSNGGYAVLPAGFDGDYNSLTNRPTLFSGDYNDLTNQPQIPQVPTNVSAFSNDAGYITANDVPLVPTNVSAFTNDAGYITMDSVPTVPTNISAFTNDVGYVTESMLTTENYITQNDLITNNYVTEADIPTNVSAFTNDAGYITMDSVPTVPTNISAFTNDAGYVTESSLTTNNYITQNDLITNNYVTEADIPTNVSAFTNDAGYITMDSVPAIPTNVSAFTNDVGYVTDAAIPTNISAFTNDAGYLTTATVQEAANIPTNVSAFNNDAGYITMDSIPAIPTVPTNVSAFANDAGYITAADVPAIPTVPTSVSAFENDANYLTSYTETDPQFNAWNKDYNDLTNRPTIPTTTGELTNNSGFITSADVPAQVNADWNATEGAAQIMNKPELFSGDYNDLTNQPQIPQVPANVSAFENDAHYITAADVPAIPTNVSAFTNDAGYITMDSIPAIPTVPTNVSAFINDAGYLTQATVQEAANIPTNVSAFANDANYITLAQVPAQVNADWNATSGAAQIMNKPELFSGDYNDLTNQPQIPQVPANVSAFENDAHYITAADVPAIPTNVSAFTNDAGYITMDSIPAIPTVPSNVSAFVNDAGYLTSATVQEAANIPTNVSAFANDANYITLAQVPAQVNADWNATSGAAQIMNKPTIPTVPTNISAFTNDAGYITMDSIPAIPTVPTNVSSFANDAGYITMDSIPAIPTIPTQVSAFENDAHYLTSYTEQQVLSISNDTIFLTGGSFAKLPAGFSGSYNDLTDVPENVSTFSNDAGYLTEANLGNILDSLYHLIDSLGNNQSGRNLPLVSTCSVQELSDHYVKVTGNVSYMGTTTIIERGICWGLSPNPTINDMHLTSDIGFGEYNVIINNIDDNSLCYIRAYAKNDAGIVYGNQLTFEPHWVCGQNIIDNEGNSYPTVLLGNQCWMRSNLATKHFLDNSAMVSGTDYYTTINLGQSSNYQDLTLNGGIYYNAASILSNTPSSTSTPSGVRSICPDNWHIPSAGEFDTLVNYAAANYSCAIKALCTCWYTPGYGSYTGTTCNPCYSSTETNATNLSIPYAFSYYGYQNTVYIANFLGPKNENSDYISTDFTGYSSASVGTIRHSTPSEAKGYVRCVRD